MRIFLSHGSRDKALIRELKANFPPWINVWIDEDRLLFGSDLELSLQNAINAEVDYVVLFLGLEALNSEWVKHEIEWALSREDELNRTFLLPVLLSDVRKELKGVGLVGRLTLECTDYSREGITTLATKMVNHLGGWLSERLKQETNLLTSSANMRQELKPAHETRYSRLVTSVAENLYALPEDWRELVETLLLRPFFRAAASSRRGKIPLNASQYYQRILHEIGLAQSGWDVFAVSTLSSDLWSDDTNQKNYAKRNLEAVKREATIRRLFILPEGKGEPFIDTIRTQADSGVKIRVANTKLLAETSDLEDFVIFQSPEYVHAYICYPAIDNPRGIRSGRLIIDPELCADLLNAFHAGWEAAMDVDDYLRSQSVEFGTYSAKSPPGLTLPVHKLASPVVTCEEAAAAKAIPLSSELKTLILETSSGLIALHLPGDGILSLRAVKDFIEAEEAYLSDPETLLQLGLSPGTVSAVLEPVWGMPHLISRRVFELDVLSTNNRTKTGYFLFDPVILTRAENVRIGEFEKMRSLEPE